MELSGFFIFLNQNFQLSIGNFLHRKFLRLAKFTKIYILKIYSFLCSPHFLYTFGATNVSPKVYIEDYFVILFKIFKRE